MCGGGGGGGGGHDTRIQRGPRLDPITNRTAVWCSTEQSPRPQSTTMHCAALRACDHRALPALQHASPAPPHTALCCCVRRATTGPGCSVPHLLLRVRPAGAPGPLRAAFLGPAAWAAGAPVPAARGSAREAPAGAAGSGIQGPGVRAAADPGSMGGTQDPGWAGGQKRELRNVVEGTLGLGGGGASTCVCVCGPSTCSTLRRGASRGPATASRAGGGPL